MPAVLGAMHVGDASVEGKSVADPRFGMPEHRGNRELPFDRALHRLVRRDRKMDRLRPGKARLAKLRQGARGREHTREILGERHFRLHGRSGLVAGQRQHAGHGTGQLGGDAPGPKVAPVCPSRKQIDDERLWRDATEEAQPRIRRPGGLSDIRDHQVQARQQARHDRRRVAMRRINRKRALVAPHDAPTSPSPAPWVPNPASSFRAAAALQCRRTPRNRRAGSRRSPRPPIGKSPGPRCRGRAQARCLPTAMLARLQRPRVIEPCRRILPGAADSVAGGKRRPRIISAAFSPIMMVGA